jgi:hypothetical protein
MKKLIGHLKLRMLMRVTLVLIRRAQARSPRLRELLASHPFVFQIQTADGVGGHFDVADGHIALRAGLHPKPDLTQLWCDGNTAVRMLTSGDETDLLRAVEDGYCRMRGRFIVALWFNEVMKLARGRVAAGLEAAPNRSSAC